MMNKNACHQKVLVIGLDGLSPMLVEQWIDELPSIQRFKKEGWFGSSIPPIPAQTPVAWTTFMTGKNPGKHGIFSFAMRDLGTYERRIANPKYMRSKTLWRILSEHRKKVGVINVPMAAYEEVNGFIIPGFLSRLEGVPRPPEIQQYVRGRFNIDSISGDIEPLYLQKVKSDPEAFFRRIDTLTDVQTKVSLDLMKHQEWDFFMTVYLGSDRIQHFFWKHVDTRHPEYTCDEYSEKVKRYYIKLDKIVGEYLDNIPEGAVTILISDHGFCPVSKEIFLNNYLEELGFLELKNEKIDYEKSVAVAYGYGDIWLNVEGREPQGKIKPGDEYEATVNEIKVNLQKIMVDDESPFGGIKKKEEIYFGDCVNNAPDLTVLFKTGWQAARSPAIDRKNPIKRYVNDHPMWSGGHDGTHDPMDVPGVLGIIGPDVQPPRIHTQVNLEDLAPTILAHLNVDVPSDMDGDPLKFKSEK